jgi:hypothetical protein
MASTFSPPQAASSLLAIDPAEFHRHFGLRAFGIKHHLSDHPLFAIERLLELARYLPEDRVEYNAGDVPMSLDPGQTPRTGLSPEETIRRIAECRSWLVLKNIERHPDYERLLHQCLTEVEALGHPDTRQIGLREAFVFISSPDAITPYHIDPEWNFLLQIRGIKYMHVYPADDSTLLSDLELEAFYSGGHRNLQFKEEFRDRERRFELHPGEGVHVPVTAPHWVQNGPEVSISFSITFQTRKSERRSVVYRVNQALRQRGWKPTRFGVSSWRDTLKYQVYRAGRKVGLWGRE